MSDDDTAAEILLEMISGLVALAAWSLCVWGCWNMTVRHVTRDLVQEMSYPQAGLLVLGVRSLQRAGGGGRK